jgi:nucleotide-binding universal stress UspA family protein
MGDPVQQIIEEAETGNYDLIVMGTHGRGVLISSIIGDTVKLVARRSRIPGLSVRIPA